ncbi:MAG: hypothetical protein LBD14_01670 [Puniceicoccales bacterium]|jgi:YVTN family beta-propeller protein|nr:hypothetical protein [Puniceicoccales bacterium]
MKKSHPALFLGLLLLGTPAANATPAPYLTPGPMSVDKDKNIVYTALTTARAVTMTPLNNPAATERIPLPQDPNDILLSPDGTTLYAACGGARGTVEIISLPSKKTQSTIPVGHTPQSLALGPGGKHLYVANRFSNTLSVIDLAQGKVTLTLPAIREPRTLLATQDGKTLAIANFLPNQPSNGLEIAAKITLVDIPTHTIRTHVTLPNGSQSVLGLIEAPDGKSLYTVHIVSQYGLPLTQLDRGWANTNALSIIDHAKGTVLATVLLDDMDNGAANPSALTLGPDNKLYIALAGTHELLTLDIPSLNKGLNDYFVGKRNDRHNTYANELTTSLSFTAPFKKRIPLQGRGPIALQTHGKDILVSNRYSTFLEKHTPDAPTPPPGTLHTTTIPLGTEPTPDAIRRGEIAFNDATLCFQRWHSCATCHPDGRADGLNWDQMNDGLGNPKNTKSLLFSHITPPCMITGIRASAELAVRKGITHILMTVQPENIALDMDAYLKNMRPLESPYLAPLDARQRKKLQEKGRELFDRAECSICHTGENHTDLQLHDVGTGTDNDKERPFDTPTLREIWRTAPYLYDGHAKTIRDVLTTHNPENKHGNTKDLTKEELEILELYINTL